MEMVQMPGKSDDRNELQRRLEQARRMIDVPLDPLTKEWLRGLLRDLEVQLQ
jgi:hypothetical protein